MKHLSMLLVLFCCSALIMSGCIGSKNRKIQVNYYILEYEAPEISPAPVLPVTLRVDRFQISPVYDTEKFISRGEAFSRNHYNYQRWRANPKDLVTYFLSRDIRNSNLFEAVFPPDSLNRSTHLITGTVDEFYEKDGDPWKAVLSVSIAVIKQNEPDVSRQVVYQKTYSIESPSDDDSPQSFVQAMSRAMASLSREITNDLYTRLSKKP